MSTDPNLTTFNHSFMVKGENVSGNVIVYLNDPARQDDLASIQKLLHRILSSLSRGPNNEKPSVPDSAHIVGIDIATGLPTELVIIPDRGI